MINSDNALKNGEVFNQKPKYENYKNHYVFINELKTKVHKTSIGVIPIRNSEKLEDLKIVMKGKLIECPKPEQTENNEPIKTERSDYNSVLGENCIQSIHPFISENPVSTIPAPPPAIIASRGTSDTIKFSDRPKPIKKKKLEIPIAQTTSSKSKNGKKESKKKENDDNLTNVEALDSELDYVKNLVNEAREISKIDQQMLTKANTNSSKSTKSHIDKKSQKESETRNSSSVAVSNEKVLLKSVESLVSAIKSGKLLKEQELSDQRIKSILNRVLDRKESIAEDKIEGLSVIEENKTNAEFSDASDAQKSNEMIVKEELPQEELNERENLNLENNLVQDAISTKSEKQSLLQSEFTPKTAFTKLSDSLLEELHRDAKLSLKVTNEDIIGIRAKKIEIISNKTEDSSNEQGKRKIIIQNDVVNSRSIHSFCFFNEKNADTLVEEDLVNVTRKYHSRAKYSKLAKLINEDLALESKKESPELDKIQSMVRSSNAAQRVLENSKNFIVKSIPSNLSEDNLKPNLDEKNTLDENFILEAMKMNISDISDSNQYALCFLRPSPPKMMIKHSVIRKKMFPLYESAAPVDYIDNAKAEAMSISTDRSDSVRSSIEDLNDEQNFQIKLTREKIIGRQYHSDTKLNSADTEPSYSNKLTKAKDKFRRFSNSIQFLNEDPEKTLYIDSNYSDALQEAVYQREKLKVHKEKLDTTNLSVTNITTTATKDEMEINLDILKSDSKSYIESNSKVSSFKPAKYFYKNNEKTQAEISLEKGRDYVTSKIAIRKNKKALFDFDAKDKFSFKMINDVDVFLKNLNNDDFPLTRSESMNKIKFHKKMPEEPQLRVPKVLKIKKRKSLPDLLNYEEFKNKNDFKQFVLADIEDNKDREWVRKIWNRWFDEVIPFFDHNNIQGDALEDNDMDEMIEEINAVYDNIDDKNTTDMNIAKSVTYEICSQIDFSMGLQSPEMQIIVEIQEEINELTKRIESKSDAFSLARRGALYRKLGYIKLALKDLDQAIGLEDRYVDAYWHRHLIYLVTNETDKALEDLNFILKVNKSHAGAYFSRGNIYAHRNDHSLAIVNYSQSIKYNPNEYQSYYKRARMYELRGDIRMAMDDYLTTTKLNPKIVDAWFKHGMNYFNNKNYSYAIVDFTELLKHNPNQSEARLYRGKCYLYLKDYQLAINDFSIAIHLDPRNWQAYYHRGSLLRKLSREQSLRDLSISIIIENSYDNIDAYLHRAILYYENQNYDEAIKDYENVLLLDKEFAPAYVNLGIIYMNIMSNYWKAIRCFNMATKSNPTYIRAYMCRAQAYRKIHNLKQAYLDYTKVIHLNPMMTEVYIRRGQIILEMGNFKLAAFCVQHAAFLNEGTVQERSSSSLEKTKANDDQSVTQKAVVYAFLKNFPKAFAVLDNELKTRPSRKTYNLLGNIFMDAKLWQEASDIYQKSITFTKLNDQQKSGYSSSAARIEKANSVEEGVLEAYFMKGKCLMELSNYNEAYQCFQKVIEASPMNHEAYFFRGLVRAYMHQRSCIQDFNRALSINPEFFEAYLARATIYGIEHRHAKAILNCNEALKINSKCVRGFLYRGALKLYSKSYQYAIQDFTSAIKLNQTCALAYYNRALSYERLNNHSQALKDYSIVLMLGDYLKFKVCINRGLLYYNLGDFANALGDFKAASEYVPTDFKIKHIIGLCYHRLGMLDNAIEILTNTINLNKNYSNALVSRGNVYVDYGNAYGFKKAYNDYAHVLIKNPCDFDARVNLAYLMQIQNKHKCSWRVFTGSMSIQNSNQLLSAAYEGRSIVCLQMSDLNAALKDINYAIKLSRSAEHFVNRGVIYQFMGDNINAMREYQAALLINPTCALANYNSGNIYLFHRQYKQALSAYNDAIEKGKLLDETVYQNRGIAKAFMSLNGDAIKDFTEALKHNKYAAHIYMNRALLLFKLKDFKNSLNDLTSALNLNNEDPLLYKIRGNCFKMLQMNVEALEDFKKAIFLEENNSAHLKIKSK